MHLLNVASIEQVHSTLIRDISVPEDIFSADESTPTVVAAAAEYMVLKGPSIAWHFRKPTTEPVCRILMRWKQDVSKKLCYFIEERTR
jgi:hypothetical protein